MLCYGSGRRGTEGWVIDKLGEGLAGTSEEGGSSSE